MASDRDVFGNTDATEGREAWNVGLGLLREGIKRLEEACYRTDTKVEGLAQRVTALETINSVVKELSHEAKQEQNQAQQSQIGHRQVSAAWVSVAIGAVMAAIGVVAGHFWK